MNLINKNQPPAACGRAIQVQKQLDEVSNVVIQPLNVLSCAFLFAGRTFAAISAKSNIKKR